MILAVNAEVCARGQVLVHQAVHILVGASLRRAERVAEVHRNARALAELLVHCHLTALVELRKLGQDHQSSGVLNKVSMALALALMKSPSH